MNIDFTLLFLLLLLVCGVTLLGQRLRPLKLWGWTSWVEFSRVAFPVLIVVVLLRSFLVEPFRIPSESMLPTLLAGDFILVNKFDYGMRVPVFEYKLTRGEMPRRGDVVVFRYPHKPSVTYIKRIVGLPGDRIRYLRDKLYIGINGGEAQRIPLHEEGSFRGKGENGTSVDLRMLRESLGEFEHLILHDPSRRDRRIAAQWVVPEGHYFVLGDNRDHSSDSRFWGFVPDGNLVGKAFIIWMHWSRQEGISWMRIGSKIE